MNVSEPFIRRPIATTLLVPRVMPAKLTVLRVKMIPLNTAWFETPAGHHASLSPLA